jgi:hypothetical protein
VIGLLYSGGGMLRLTACLLIGLVGGRSGAICTSIDGVVLAIIGVTLRVINRTAAPIRAQENPSRNRPYSAIILSPRFRHFYGRRQAVGPVVPPATARRRNRPGSVGGPVTTPNDPASHPRRMQAKLEG